MAFGEDWQDFQVVFRFNVSVKIQPCLKILREFNINLLKLISMCRGIGQEQIPCELVGLFGFF